MDLIPSPICEVEISTVDEYIHVYREFPTPLEEEHSFPIANMSTIEEDGAAVRDFLSDDGSARPGEKRLRDEDDVEWNVVGRREKKKKPHNENIEVYISCQEKLPKQFCLARLLKNNDIREIEKVKYVNPYKIRLEVGDESSAQKIESCKEFSDKGWHVQRPLEQNLSYGVIRDVDIDITEEDILKGISCPPPAVLLSIHRLKRRNQNDDSGWSMSECVRLCFKGPLLPQYVAVDGLKIRVDPYLFPVSQCSKCWKLGHTVKKCPSTKIVCPKCGGNHSNCETTSFKCVNCRGNHMSLVKTCPAFRKEKKLREIMAENNCTYRKAMLIYTPLPKEDISEETTYSKVHVPDINDANFFPNLKTPRKMPSFAENTTVESEEVIHYVDMEEDYNSQIPPRPKKQARRRNRKEAEADYDFPPPTGDADETRQNTEGNQKEGRDRGKFSELLVRLKEILFLRGVSIEFKLKSAFKSCVDWCILVVTDYISDWPVIKVIMNYIINNG